MNKYFTPLITLIIVFIFHTTMEASMTPVLSETANLEVLTTKSNKSNKKKKKKKRSKNKKKYKNKRYNNKNNNYKKKQNNSYKRKQNNNYKKKQNINNKKKQNNNNQKRKNYTQNKKKNRENRRTTNSLVSSTGNHPTSGTMNDKLLIATGVSGQLLHRTGYITSYNKDKRVPFWTAWKLTSSHTTGTCQRKGTEYAADPDITGPRADNSDYSRSGYDRGHMCPAGDNKWDLKAMRQTFLFTNMCPQVGVLNQGGWNDLEIKCRAWARKYGAMYIVCGPIFNGKSHKTIGSHKVAVPDAFFKVILCMEGTPKAIGFIYNNDTSRGSIPSHAVSVDEVERMTGLDFYPALPDNIEQRVESENNFKDWQ